MDSQPAPGPIEVVEHTSWVEEGRVAYATAGEGMPVVFLHGWALGHQTYRAVIAEVAAQGVRVLAPAMPGFGGTDPLPEREFSLAGYARWVTAFLRRLNVHEPVVILGHSLARPGDEATSSPRSPGDHCGTGGCTFPPTYGRGGRPPGSFR
jgi:hypothetical protein